MTNEMARNASFFLAGALLGGAVVTLVTPWSGRRFRRLIWRKVEGGVDQVLDVKKNIHHMGEELRHRGETIARAANGVMGAKLFG